MFIESNASLLSSGKATFSTKIWAYAFSEGDPADKQLLGGKGANLCAMSQMGLNVPPGFVITTDACRAFLKDNDRRLPSGLMDQVRAQIRRLEEATGKGFGNSANPLLVAVRSGSALSMPGMMDTILNLGLGPATLPGLMEKTKNPRFVYDAWRRLIQLFSRIALGVPEEKFDEAQTVLLKEFGVKLERDLDADGLKVLAERFLKVTEEATGNPFPVTADEQLELAIRAVFNSWNGKRAVDYRREFRITPEMADGTAVSIMAMVFGNMGADSATGVGFTRDPGTGENVLYGEYLVNAQGEEVVAGIRTPKSVSDMASEMPEMYRQLQELRDKLEKNFREVQDFEYTIEKGVLYCLQTRNGKMNARALVRTSVEMVAEGLLTREQAVLRIRPDVLEQLLHPTLDASVDAKPLAVGIPASPGAATGKAVFSADEAVARHSAGEAVILIREETRPEDIHGFFASVGVLTSRGGKTSHAAVVARGMGKPCVAGAGGLKVIETLRYAEVGDQLIREGDPVTLDGTTGKVYAGILTMVLPEFSEGLKTLLSWADEFARIRVRANADTPADALRALEYGATGIGLCRTERMFNAPERIPLIRNLMMVSSDEERTDILKKLSEFQFRDFLELFRIMKGLPVTVRLLDPPMHEFLPSADRLREEIASLQTLLPISEAMQVLHQDGMVSAIDALSADTIRTAIRRKEQLLNQAVALHEVNPMLGHRGVRLGITRPEIYLMQVSAILDAVVACRKEGIPVHPEIMVPQVALPDELTHVRALAEQAAADVEQCTGERPEWAFGTMVEVVRACLVAGEIAPKVNFFSFGTNDLTQATLSFSREDAEQRFLPAYLSKGILADNPFEVLDLSGVGRLMKIAVEEGRASNPRLQVGICGEHGGHPEAVAFCASIGLDYVSCSPPRVLVARLAAAHAQLSIVRKP